MTGYRLKTPLAFFEIGRAPGRELQHLFPGAGEALARQNVEVARSYAACARSQIRLALTLRDWEIFLAFLKDQARADRARAGARGRI